MAATRRCCLQCGLFRIEGMMLSPEEQIKAEAHRLGCDLVGITAAGQMAEESAHLDEWLRRGYAGGMGWMERRKEERKNPATVLSGARSVVVVGVNYYTPYQHDESPGTGKVSRYAWGGDYHQVLDKILMQLGEFIEATFAGVKTRTYVDTGPVMEKALAVRAGIGWQGKHSNVISKTLGSWFFLGEVLTTLELVPDRPAVDHCGSCTRCIEACPTAAIVEPYVVDARRCLSYLTIEHRGPIPEELAKDNDGWLFGCDICQDICPWNTRHRRATSHSAFMPRGGRTVVPLDEALTLSREEFTRRYAGSPLLRTRWEGFLRNVDMIRRFPPHGAVS